MSEQGEVNGDGCHEHGSDADGGVPFWRRAAITEGQLAKLKIDLQSTCSEVDGLRKKVHEQDKLIKAAEWLLAELNKIAIPIEAAHAELELKQWVRKVKGQE